MILAYLGLIFAWTRGWRLHIESFLHRMWRNVLSGKKKTSPIFKKLEPVWYFKGT